MWAGSLGRHFDVKAVLPLSNNKAHRLTQRTPLPQSQPTAAAQHASLVTVPIETQLQKTPQGKSFSCNAAIKQVELTEAKTRP